MDTTYETVLQRIEEAPIRYLGGTSPKLIGYFFSGYDLARQLHSAPPLSGALTRAEFGEWFQATFNPGSQGAFGVCELVTDTDEEALQLFFEFWRRATAAKNVNSKKVEAEVQEPMEGASMVELILSDAIRKRPAMYFGNNDWVRGLWAMWSGYIEAERDLQLEDTEDIKTFCGFQEWVWIRHPQSEGKNWGKLYIYLGLDSNPRALEIFFDEFELYRSGGAPDARTKRFQEFIDSALEAVRNDQAQSSES